MEILSLLPQHWEDVKLIYEQGIATGNATFQTTAPNWNEWDTSHLPHCRLVAIQGNIVAGWAALTPVSGRCVYAGVAEVSIYIANEFKGEGIGKKLLQQLITESELHKIWTLQAGIFPENESSIQLHKTCGFRIVGIREKLGVTNSGWWRDVVLLERRSKTTGI